MGTKHVWVQDIAGLNHIFHGKITEKNVGDSSVIKARIMLGLSSGR